MVDRATLEYSLKDLAHMRLVFHHLPADDGGVAHLGQGEKESAPPEAFQANSVMQVIEYRFNLLRRAECLFGSIGDIFKR